MNQFIDRYEIIELLGKGGMASVFRARDPRFNRDVAIKVMPREFLHDETFQARFAQEAQTLARFEHSAIVPIYDYGTFDGQPFLVMRHMGGGSLADRVNASPLSLEEAVRVLGRIGPALDMAHQRGIIHRDIKPANILLDEHGDPYLSDFGIVKLTESTAQLTGTAIVGTPSYMAPEVADAGGVTPLIDIYALGVTLFEMLTGELPYKADTPIGLIAAHSLKPIPDVLAYRPGLPVMVRIVMNRAIAKDPAARYQSAAALVADLEAALAGETPDKTLVDPAVHDPYAQTIPDTPPPQTSFPAQTPIPPPSPAPPPRRKGKKRSIPSWMLIGGGLAALVCLAVIVVGMAMLTGFDLTFGDGEATSEPAADQVEEVEPTEAEQVIIIEPNNEPSPTTAPPTAVPTTVPTDPPTNTSVPGPSISNIRFCNKPCDEPGAYEVTVYAEGTTDVYISWNYDNMEKGMFYTREWYNRNELWVRYECTWQGPSSGVWDLVLYDRTGGLRSGVWVLSITVDGELVGEGSIEVAGNNNHWDPFTSVPACPDW